MNEEIDIYIYTYVHAYYLHRSPNTYMTKLNQPIPNWDPQCAPAGRSSHPRRNR